MITLLNCDCMEYMKTVPDKYFDLAIVDPPYGVEEITGKEFSHGRGKLKNRIFNKGNEKINGWDKSPDEQYFNELFRISVHQIIWGGNYYDLPKYRCVIVWDKCQPFENFSAVEIAWTSYNKPSKLYKYDNRYSNKIHPMQKPIIIYKNILRDFAENTMKIFDSHGGSFSSAIACYDFGTAEYVGCELDKDYYDKAVERYNNHIAQTNLFK